MVLLALVTATVAATRSPGSISGRLVATAPQAPIADSGADYLRSPLVLTTSLPVVEELAVQSQMEAMLGSVPQVTPEPTAAPTSDLTPPFSDYIIQPGDTIIDIARNFGISPNYIFWNNPLVSADPTLLEVGEVLVIPSIDALIYRIKLSDTVTDVATHYDIDLSSIVTANGLASPDVIGEDAVILLPGAVPPSPAPAPVFVAAPAPAPAPPSATSTSSYIWPWYGIITSYFDEWRGSGVHGAIDINGAGNYGASVLAAAPGQIILTAYETYGYGYHVVIAHDDGSQTLYAHLSNIYAVQGQWVAQGEAIGALGNTGYSTGTHLHFEIIIGGVNVDPLAYLP